MFSGLMHLESFCQIQPTMKKEMKKGKELLAIWRKMQEELLLPKFGFSKEETKDILDKYLELMLN